MFYKCVVKYLQITQEMSLEWSDLWNKVLLWRHRTLIHLWMVEKCDLNNRVRRLLDVFGRSEPPYLSLLLIGSLPQLSLGLSKNIRVRTNQRQRRGEVFFLCLCSGSRLRPFWPMRGENVHWFRAEQTLTSCTLGFLSPVCTYMWLNVTESVFK